ncbi:hypothetical protein ASE92_06650 [Pedobacter sp. Leaf41]|uniref:hypothetical protein n=1 Tax=Pedobacter sp. Leaf41 TaxID=1736218 RepID=UPI000702561A|nr:hypothetical protein [Pedobacter sp. Leaf41]KQN35821.1 hypothetical protein ASE92_06650 [Pedobacter sp. Leaf41]
MKNYIFGLAAIAIAFAASAFTTTENASNRSTYFYKYKLTTYTQAQIENPANYERAVDNCGLGAHVCGVSLDTDNGPSSQPDADEFDNVKAELWSSEQADVATLAEIKMRN